MTLATIKNNRLVDWSKLDNLPADTNASLALKADKTTTINGLDLSTNRTLTQDNIWDWTTYKQYSQTEKTKLAWIEAGAEVNTLNDIIAGTNITIDKTDPFNPVINNVGAWSGDVVWPASAVNNNFVSFDTTTWKLIKDSWSKASDFQTALWYTAEDSANKDNTWWYVWLTLFKINFKNVLNTITSFFTNSNTIARTYTFPDKDWTVAMTSDITWTNSWTNTWDQTSIVWITWTKAQFDTAVSDWNIVYVWDTVGKSTNLAWWNGTTLLWSVPYQSNTDTTTQLAPNTTTTKKFLTQTWTWTNWAIPAWSTIVAWDVPTLNQNTTWTSSNVTGTVAIANGWTWQTTANAWFNALAPTTTEWDIIYRNATVNTRLSKGTANQVLTMNAWATAPEWKTPAVWWDTTANIWYLNIPQNSQSIAYTLVLADSWKHIYHPSADTTARTWTIPANSSVAYPIGTAITIINDTSAWTLTIAITTDTLVLAWAWTTWSRTLAANWIATAIKVTSTRWMISWTWLT